jgi:hypothetical protein
LGNSSAFGKALAELKHLGLIDRVPRMAIINASGADTLFRLYEERGLRWSGGRPRAELVKAFYDEMDQTGRRAATLASAIEINRPVNLKKALRSLDITQGVVRRVSDQEILDAKAQVTFDRESVASYRLVGYENRAVSDRDFKNDGVAAGAIGAGHAVTALYVLRLQPGTGSRSHLARVTVRWTDPDRGGALDLGRDVAMSDLAGSFRSTSPSFRLDAIVAQTAEVLRGSEFAGRLDLRDVADVANREVGENVRREHARRELASEPAKPAVIEAACNSEVAGVPPSVKVMFVSLLAVSAAGVTVEIAAQAKPLPFT